eukprot:356000-Chlamydomonas_euryale.AAC.1
MDGCRTGLAGWVEWMDALTIDGWMMDAWAAGCVVGQMDEQLDGRTCVRMGWVGYSHAAARMA